MKFSLNKVQYAIYQVMWWLNIILKSRQHGVTTFIAIFCLDMCLFNSNIRAGFVAHSLDAAQEIFADKIKYPYDNLPDWLKAEIPATKDDAGHLKLANNSSIRVATTMRGGTLQFLHVSEYGKICAQYPERAKEIRSGCLEAVHEGAFVFIESTAESESDDGAEQTVEGEDMGEGNDFERRCNIAQGLTKSGQTLTRLDYRFFFFGWWEDPENRLSDAEAAMIEITPAMRQYFEKLEVNHGIVLDAGQKGWYVQKKRSLGFLVKREQPSIPAEAFAGAIRGAYYGDEMDRAYDEGRITRVPYDRRLPVHTVWDLGMHDSMAVGFVQIAGLELHWIDYYENNHKGFEHYAKVLKEEGYLYGRHIAPFDIAVQEMGSGLSRKQMAKKVGIGFTELPQLSVMAGILHLRNLIDRSWFDAEKCAGSSGPCGITARNTTRNSDATRTDRCTTGHHTPPIWADTLRWR